MDPTSVKEPVVAAEAELKATAMKAAANHQSLEASISRPDRLMGENGIKFIEPALHGTVRSDNGTSVPPLSDEHDAEGADLATARGKTFAGWIFHR